MTAYKTDAGRREAPTWPDYGRRFIEGARRKVSVDGSWCGGPELALSHPNDCALRKAYIYSQDIWCDTPCIPRIFSEGKSRSGRKEGLNKIKLHLRDKSTDHDGRSK